jgi:heptosyltransferase-1
VTIERLLVVRLGSMGDIIHTLPAVASLRRAFPSATIGWAVEPRWASLLSSELALNGTRSPEKPLVDTVHAVDTLGWRRAPLSGETWRAARRALKEMRDPRYDIAIDFQGAWKSALVAQLSRAPRRLGYMQPREKPATLFYTHQVPATGRHIVEQNISLATDVCGLGLRPASQNELCFPLPCDRSAELAVEQQLRERGLPSFAMVNPGAGWGAKCWPAERYAEVMRAIAVHGLRSIVNFGPGEEKLARAVEHHAGGAAIPISSSVAELIALTRRARLFVGGDTGPMHLAAALGVPVVALFGPTDPARTGPYGNRAIVLRSQASRTTTSHRPEPEAGLMQITAAEVIAAARWLLTQPAEVRP